MENSSHVSSRQVENVSGGQCKVPHSVVVAPHSDYPKNVETICERTLAKGGIEPTNKMTEDNTELLTTKYWKWGFDENTLNTLMPPFLTKVRAKVASATVKVEHTQARAKETSIQTNVHKLENTLTKLEDLQDFESTVTEFYIQALSKDPTSQEKQRAEHTATDRLRNTSDHVIKAATKTLKRI